MKNMNLIWFCFLLVGFCQCAYLRDEFRKKDGPSLAERVSQLTRMSVLNPILIFNHVHFHAFVKTTPRNYSIVVLFTAMAAKHKCNACQIVLNELQIVANSFRFSEMYSNKLFFALFDVDEGGNIFRKLQLKKVPVLMHFPPKGKPKLRDTMAIQKVGIDEKNIAKWIAERTDIQIKVIRSTDYMSVVRFIILFAIVPSFLYMKQNNLNFLFDKNLWGIASMIFCLLMASGHMWNVIQAPAFFHQNRQGEIRFVNTSLNEQFLLESCIIVILNAASALGFVLIIEAKAQNKDIQTRRIMAVTGIVLLMIGFNLVVSIFKYKTSHQYPFGFSTL